MQDQSTFSNQDSARFQNTVNSKNPGSVPSDVKRYETPIKRMENEAGYREWLDRGKLGIPPHGDLTDAQQRQYQARSEQDLSLTHEINGMLQSNQPDATDLRVSVNDCEVTVVGCVPDRETMDQIVALCEKAKDVRCVINQLKIYDHDHGPEVECITTNTKIETHTHSHLDPEPSVSFADKVKENGFTATTTKLLASAFEALQR